MAAILSVAAAPGPAQADPGDGWESLEGIYGMVLGVAGGSDANGAKVVQWTPVYQSDGQAIPDQDWLIVGHGNGIYSFRNAGTADRKALAVSGGSKKNGAPIIQWTYQPNNPDQQWRLEYTGTAVGHFQLRNVNSNLCLAIPAGSSVKGTQAIQYTCMDNVGDQVWNFVDN